MIDQDVNPAPCSRLYELLEQLKRNNEEIAKYREEEKRSWEAIKVLRGKRARQKSFAYMLRIEAPVTLREQWVNEDEARFNAWLDDDHFPYVSDYISIPFEKWLRPKAGGQFFAPATNNIRPEKIVETAEEEPRPPVLSVETVVGLEERVQIFGPKIDSENDSSDECSNFEQGRDIGLAQETTPIDMIIGNKAEMEKSCSAKLFELKAEIMPRGHNNCSTHSAAENEKYFAGPNIFGDDSLFGLKRNHAENFNTKLPRLGIKHRWPPPVYVWINSTVKATGDIFSLDKQHWSRRISRPRSTFSLDKQHCKGADWLFIQVSVEKDFRIPIGRGHLISLLGEVRCYRLLHSAHRKPNLILNFAELAALSSGSRTRRPRIVPSSAAIARRRSQPRTQRNINIFYSPAELGRRVGTPRTTPKDVVSF